MEMSTKSSRKPHEHLPLRHRTGKSRAASASKYLYSLRAYVACAGLDGDIKSVYHRSCTSAQLSDGFTLFEYYFARRGAAFTCRQMAHSVYETSGLSLGAHVVQLHTVHQRTFTLACPDGDGAHA